ncbi:3-beta hydroxysteroid dehydrogenase [Cephaloticoccus capnophilus]|uniref:3-beta hydroxysteroid dehydrogenase n=1 Tax=Cephaloticoccus capnophilus TaxID=1548208 RepID=A0A139SKH0_9BACT|nr:NAD-dependent epimerase/dehydratase family protein [Cephaloticoccus capnophilus]KXU35035.1 3-beta hydroxysteroid dehydrogenase [Cephaloticoccus capnophilus]
MSSHTSSGSSTLVTGGTGFLGKRLVLRLLAEERRVTVLSRRADAELASRGVRFVCASLDDVQAVRAACAGQGTVFHTAAKVGVWGRYTEFYKTNVLGTRAVIEGCREHGVARLVYTSTPSVVYNGRDIAGGDESLPLTTRCPSPYPLTKAIAEREVLAANSENLRTAALRPHLIWGAGDPHLVPRLLAAARCGRLRIVGDGKNRVDMVHVENAVDAHLLAEAALHRDFARNTAAGRPYFITDGEPVRLWDWVDGLLRALGEPSVTRRISLRGALRLGGFCEGLWRALPFLLRGEPPMTRFIAAELAKDHWFDIGAARRELGYVPRVSMEQGFRELIDWLHRP